MENRIIDLNTEIPLFAEWEEWNYHNLTIKGFEPLKLLPTLEEVSGVVVKVEKVNEFDDDDIFLTDTDITLKNGKSHLTYTIRVRTKERLGNPCWELLYYNAQLHSVASEDLPYWADSFEEMAQIKYENFKFPLNF